MGLLQWAYETYEHNAHLAGVLVKDQKEPLTPVSHMIQNAQIEITLSYDGAFSSAQAVPKEDNRTIIPVTEASASRTSHFYPHPLCDQLLCLAPWGEEKYRDYLDQLDQWAQSPYSHPKVRAVLAYVRRGSILDDLSASGVMERTADGELAANKIEGTEFRKCLVRWRILSAPEGSTSACWEDRTLFDCFAAYYHSRQSGAERDLCLITGQQDTAATSHPKGVLSASFGAKLISANDNSGFTYRGRFTQAQESGGVGYSASQKAHSALRWVAANQGVILGGRTFLCWNPGGKPLPRFDFLGFGGEPDAQPTADPVSYRRQLKQTLSGYRQALEETDDVVIAALDAATTGRLSVPYYNMLKASDFIARLERWYSSCCWPFGWGQTAAIRSPHAKQLVNCAYGTQKGPYIQADDSLLKVHAQRLLHCVVDGQAIPADFVRALAARASTPLAYKQDNRAYLLSTACAVIRSYHNSRSNTSETEEWTMALDTENPNRSYLFGRLLAVAEQVERSTYSREEKRDPNAIRIQPVFCQRPMYAWGILETALNPYYARLAPGLRRYYRDITGEIVSKLPPMDDPDLNSRLDDVYLLGYYLQRAELTRSHKIQTAEDMEETEDECTEQEN